MNPGQMIRHNRNHTPSQNRANGSQSPYQHQRFPNSHMSHQLGPNVNPHHNHLSAGGYPRPGSQDVEFPLRILVQSNMVGAIIGRFGSTIKQIIQQSNARVDVHREDNLDHQEKVVSISGSHDSCSAACFRIMEIIQNEKVQAVANHSSDEHNSLDLSETILKILAHNNLIGRLIGKNGASIKKIMDQTSTKINISHSSLTDCTNERIITIVGNLEQVRQAEQIIFSRLRTAYLSDMNVSMQAISQQQYLFGNVPVPYMPYVNNPIISTPVNPQTSHSGHTIPRSMAVNSQGQIASSPLYPNAPFVNFYQNVGIPSSSHRLLAYHPAMTGLEFEKETVNVYVPNSMVGAIIGKSGSAIKEMINCSGASIKVASIPLSSESFPAQQSRGENAHEQDLASSTQTDNLETNPIPDSNSSEPSEDPQIHPIVDQKPRETRHYDNIDDASATRKVTVVGSPEAQWSAQCMIFRKVSTENRKSEISLMVEIQVPSKLVGKIIGKGGVTIKNIQKQSRATIRLPDERPNPTEELDSNSETSIQIIGDFRSSQMAQRQIRHLIKDNPHRQQRNRPNTSRQEEGNENKGDAQEPNYQTQTDTKYPVEADGEGVGESEESKKHDKKAQDHNHPVQSVSPSNIDRIADSPEDTVTTITSGSQQASTGDTSDVKSEDENGSINSNNNTIEKNLNIDNKLSNEDSPSFGSTVKREGNFDAKDHDKLDSCRVENGENVINSITHCAKQKSIVVDPSKDEHAPVNNGR